MNNLSWTIYFAGVAQVIIMLAFSCTFIGGMGTFISGFAYFICLCDEIHNFAVMWKNVFKISAYALIIGVTLSILIPTKETITLIVVSEMLGNQKDGVIIDPSVELLQTYIKKALESLQKKDQK